MSNWNREYSDAEAELVEEIEYLRMIGKEDREKVRRVRDRNAELVEALESIAANSCCDKCQEAALIARKVLAG